jgi:L-amino acid N-acyltransferase YncA
MTDAKDIGIEIRTMRADDWPRVASIYEAGIATGDATFETEAPPWDAWDEGHLEQPRLVACAAGAVVGWAALSPVSERCVYQGVAEVSVYVDPAASGQGVGRAVLGALVEASESAGIWTLQTGIFPENTASLALHQRCGFRVVGLREKIGQMGDRWRDVVFLERRSPAI